MQPAPQPKGPSIALVVIVCLAAAFFFVPFALGGYLGFVRYRDRARATKTKTPAPVSSALSERYRTKNGLLTAHYPLDFEAKRLDEATVTLSRTREGGGDELITLGAVPIEGAEPADVHEFASRMLALVDENVDTKGGSGTHGERRDAKCLGKYDGVEFDVSFKLPDAGEYVGRACFFLHSRRYHVARYDVSTKHADADAPVLRKIIAATELAP